MKLIMIPVEGPIDLVEIDDSVFTETFDLFGPDYMEHVKFGMPGEERAPYHGIDENRRVVMLVNENGRLRDLPVNRRASVLYQGGRHSTPIVGVAYLCMLNMNAMDDDGWSSIEGQYSSPEYWDHVCAATEFRS